MIVADICEAIDIEKNVGEAMQATSQKITSKSFASGVNGLIEKKLT